MPEPIDAHLEQLARRRAATIALLPGTEQVAMVMRDLIDSGLPGYTEPPDAPFIIPDDVPAALREQLIAWEEGQTLRAQLWAEDRFKLGFAIGAGMFADIFLDLP